MTNSGALDTSHSIRLCLLPDAPLMARIVDEAQARAYRVDACQACGKKGEELSVLWGIWRCPSCYDFLRREHTEEFN